MANAALPAGGGPAAGAPTSLSESQWADLLLEDIPAPVNATNERNIEVWMENEEPPAQWWGGYGSAAAPTRLNPLNASVGSGSGGGVSAGGLGTYSNLATAAHYTAGMINQSNMAPIKTALEATDDPTDFGNAVISSPWASSHYEHEVSRFTGTPTLGPTVTNPSAIGNPGALPAATGSIGATVGSAVGSATASASSGSGILGDVEKGGAYLALILAGAGLVVLGLWKIANPGTSIRQGVTSAATTAAVVAA